MRISQLFTKNEDGTRSNFNPIVDEADVLPAQSEETKGLFLKSNGTVSEWADVAIDVDSALSTTSPNPVQNAVITAKVNDLHLQFDNYKEAINTLIAKYKS